MEKQVIEFRPELFWDVDASKIDPDKSAKYIIARILDFGRDAEVRWMYHYYPKQTIHEVAYKSRGLHPQTRALWQLMTA